MNITKSELTLSAESAGVSEQSTVKTVVFPGSFRRLAFSTVQAYYLGLTNSD